MAYASSEPVAVPYASWIQRVGAYLIDAVIVAVPYFIGHVIGGATVGLLFALIGLAILAYNRWYQAGTTGQSWGKKALNLKLISETTGEPIGFGLSFVRDICHILDSLACYIGWLFPLWDAKRQTFADKILSTIVVPV